MRVVFITGTDTNVGKTAVAALAAAQLSQTGSNFRAVKPFCSGERTDALLLRDLQGMRLSLDAINPFYFSEPLSPWTAARRAGRSITLRETLDILLSHARACDLLLVEGAGGLLSPLGDQFNAADLIVALNAEPIVVAGNRLGVLNHVCLTIEALAQRQVKCRKLALVERGSSAPASDTNEEDLRSLCPDLTLVRIPFFPNYRPEASFIRSAVREVSASLTALLQ